jgi:uncharacterized protein YnzC (UPF0291/DUF896 family)
MDFRDKLRQATERGEQQRAARQAEQQAAALTEEEYKRRHAALRRELTEYIEQCLHQLADHYPGFRHQTVVDERGWGSAVSRDDLHLAAGKRTNLFSRLQVLVSPYNEFKVLDVVAKGAIRNRENFSRNHYQELDDVDLDEFRKLIEKWVLDYAQRYAA